MIRKADRELKERWSERFAQLAPEAKEALAQALSDLRTDARKRAQYAWQKNKYSYVAGEPMLRQ